MRGSSYGEVERRDPVPLCNSQAKSQSTALLRLVTCSYLLSWTTRVDPRKSSQMPMSQSTPVDWRSRPGTTRGVVVRWTVQPPWLVTSETTSLRATQSAVW